MEKNVTASTDREMTVKKTVLKLIAEVNGTIPELLNEKQELSKAGMDSIDIVELSLALETEFDISIPDADYEQWSTIESVVEYINSKEAKA